MALALVAVALAGCGGGSGGVGATEFEDVKPCLERLGLVAANRFTGTVTTPTGEVRTFEVPEGTNVVEWSVDVAYRTTARGANAAHLAFYEDAGAAKDELTRTRTVGRNAPAGTAIANQRMLAQADLAGDTAVLTWSTPPTTQQKRRLKACF